MAEPIENPFAELVSFKKQSQQIQPSQNPFAELINPEQAAFRSTYGIDTAVPDATLSYAPVDPTLYEKTFQGISQEDKQAYLKYANTGSYWGDFVANGKKELNELARGMAVVGKMALAEVRKERETPDTWKYGILGKMGRHPLAPLSPEDTLNLMGRFAKGTPH